MPNKQWSLFAYSCVCVCVPLCNACASTSSEAVRSLIRGKRGEGVRDVARNCVCLCVSDHHTCSYQALLMHPNDVSDHFKGLMS